MSAEPTWRFRTLSADEVELEPTQRDQFNNDEVGLADAIVRESIQNSTDAPAGTGIVKVRFAIHELGSTEAAKLRSCFGALEPHLAACGIDANVMNADDARVLVIEDFNTIGLTGDPATLDKSNFRNFWRVHGRSGKSGQQGGRWGLGKLVYSSASQIHAFFGCTLRKGDTSPLLLGQAVLLNHELADKRHPAHGFWFRDTGHDGIQLPITDKDFVRDFEKLSGLQRADNTGLSLIIPYPQSSITEDALLSGIAKNYYFPVLAGRLEVECGSATLDRSNFLQAAADIPDLGIPLNFVRDVSDRLGKVPTAISSRSANAGPFEEGHFSPEDLTYLREEYAADRMVHVKLPVNLYKKDGAALEGAIELFLQKPPITGESFALFVRGALTVPGEQKHFQGLPAYGAMVAMDGNTATFLGDAENPAHTSWNPQAEKVVANWQAPYNTLKGIRQALRSLYSLLAEQVEQTEPDVLIDFFSLIDANPASGKRKKRTPIPNPVVPPREKSILVRPREGGFAIAAGPGASKWTYPKIVRVRTAYDMLGSDPFKRFSKFDFDLAKGIELETTNMEADVIKPNVMQLKLLTADFSLEASGFDVNRDLLVEARSIG